MPIHLCVCALVICTWYFAEKWTLKTYLDFQILLIRLSPFLTVWSQLNEAIALSKFYLIWTRSSLPQYFMWIYWLRLKRPKYNPIIVILVVFFAKYNKRTEKSNWLPDKSMAWFTLLPDMPQEHILTLHTHNFVVPPQWPPGKDKVFVLVQSKTLGHQASSHDCHCTLSANSPASYIFISSASCKLFWYSCTARLWTLHFSPCGR